MGPYNLTITTTVSLVRPWIRCPFHNGPYIAAPSTTGSNSFTVIWYWSHDSGHWSWNQSPKELKAQHPQFPEASDMIIPAKPGLWLENSMLVPFHMGRKQDHHRKSDLTSWFNRIKWCSSFATVDSDINLRRNYLPGLTTQHACCSCPIKDSNCCLEQDRRTVGL